jgi:hypothetical protein
MAMNFTGKMGHGISPENVIFPLYWCLMMELKYISKPFEIQI